MDEETGREGEEEIEASGDSVVIAGGLHAIAEGLIRIAEAVNRLADAQTIEDDEPHEPLSYMDGKRI